MGQRMLVPGRGSTNLVGAKDAYWPYFENISFRFPKSIMFWQGNPKAEERKVSRMRTELDYYILQVFLWLYVMVRAELQAFC